jgi:hypothetical protein
MPIDDALDSLDVVEIPRTIEGVQALHSDKFKIYIKSNEPYFIIVEPKRRRYKDIKGEGSYKLRYGFPSAHGMSLDFSDKFVFLENPKNNVVWQAVYYNSKQKTWKYKYEDTEYVKAITLKTKLDLDDWFHETEKSIFESIPELEGFIKRCQLMKD